jgi:cellulose synthase/poly-beta-1,6-N-acetylglucosamine synthase-like glycosyltransferase
METWKIIVLSCYFTIMVILSVYGIHRYFLVYLFYKHKKSEPKPKRLFSDLPGVVVQLPVFNEALVVERLIDSVCAFDYPRELLEIQVLDDSTDETCDIAQAAVDRWHAKGFDISRIHRTDRRGYKAGALEEGLKHTDKEFVTIFDADFVPKPGMIKEIIHHFTDDKIGMVQVRWGHINRTFSLLTRLQSILLDGHFVIEHTARNRSGRFFNFNGTAGIWRRSCIEDAGGWHHNTLTEDLDLSYRAQLKGWQFIYAFREVAPAELPIEMEAFKSQQHRWAKGSIQTARKNLGEIWKSNVPMKAKVEATFHLTSNVNYVLMIIVSFLMLPALLIRLNDPSATRSFLFDLSIFMAATTSVLSFYLASQREAYINWKRQILYFPMLLSLGIGLSVNNARAVLEAIFGHDVTFIRTPKYAITSQSEKKEARKTHRYRPQRALWVGLELFLGAYFVLITSIALYNGQLLTGFFLGLFMVGYLWVGSASLFQFRKAPSPIAAN